MFAIPFNRPYMTGNEFLNLAQAKSGDMLAGDGPFTLACHSWLERQSGARKALLTHSCTAALEMAALLLDFQAGDEFIMPSFTFVSTANAFVLRGGVPVFVDIRADTQNMDERLIEAAITARTKAIVVVHYAGVACEMDAICALAERFGLHVVEDAAQGIMARYRGRPLGSMGAVGAYSFHETKNLISGEGGAILLNRADLVGRAEIIREKGTDRSRFFRGEVDKYTWTDIGSSYLPGELTAAFLAAQFAAAQEITEQRIALWLRYHDLLAPMAMRGEVCRPVVPPHCSHNGHMYYVLLPEGVRRASVIASMKTAGVNAVFHYVPLHGSPAGKRYGRVSGDMAVTEVAAERLLRLPMWIGLTHEQQSLVVEALQRALD